MKTMRINLLSIIRKFKYAVLLNVAGFSAAFAAFIIIMMQLHYEYTFDEYHPNASRIYRVERSYSWGSSAIQTRPFIDEVINSSPYILAGSIYTPYSGDYYFSVEDDPESSGYSEPMIYCYPGITDVFNFTMVEGDAGCLEHPGKALIPQTLAIKLFGDRPATGKILRPLFDYKEMEEVFGFSDLEVGGVYKDFPKNTQLNNAIYGNIGKLNLGNRVNMNYLSYVLLDGNVSPQDVIDNFNRTSESAKLEVEDDESFSLALVPLKDLYFSGYSDGIQKTGNKNTSNILLLIALLVVIIAAINYTNFSTSVAPMRIKSINTQKVLGASDFLLRKTLLLETLTVCMVSFLISLVIIYSFNKTGYITFVDTDLAFSSHMPVLVMTGIVAFIIGIIAGVYPAYYMMKYPPAMVLKGSFGLSPSGKKLRTGLVGFQFMVSFILIIAAFFIYGQNEYMKHFNLGFDTDQIAVIYAGPKSVEQKDVYVNKLKENPNIEDVAFTMFKIGGTNTYMSWGGMKYQGKEFNSYILPVSSNFLDMMGIPYEGQELLTSFDASEAHYLIPNKKLMQEFEMEPNSTIEVSWHEKGPFGVLGFADNINPKSLKYTIENFCFMIGQSNSHNSYIKIKAGSNIEDVVEHIRQTVAEIDPAWPFEIEFFDTIYDNMYKKELNTSKMIFLFSLLAIIIFIVGVFALVVFETQYRFKEIGIRKVHGASIAGILWMFNRHYLKILVVCFVIASPFAWYAVSEWLKGFAYQTPLYWWVYVLAFLIVSFITILTVTYQSWQTAVKNPTDSIRTE
ncbi:MAG: ABC transporter permease [Tannerella sp.]|jgi:putative ABC transport system permease protein|nr:ABC transporter permease [Tannerella sp.]